MSHSISATDTAKLVRQSLKSAFPGIIFSVTTKKYSGGSSITVDWTDGPAVKEVEKVAAKFHGTEFDGMQDLKSYNDQPYCNDFIFFSREYSDPVVKAAVDWYLGYYGDPAPVEFVPSTTSGRWTTSAYAKTDDYRAQEHINQYMREQSYS